jgi:glycosyltransferase involved in cell wall biosynthesis
MRILMVTPAFLPEIGGVERHVHEVARRLVDRGCSVTVLTADRSGRMARQERRDGVEIRRVRAWPADADVRLAPGLGRRMRSARWDVVHVQSYHTLVAPVAMATAARARLPYVVTFHGGGHSSALRNRARRRQRAALRPLLARARRLIAVAPFEIDLYGRELALPRDRFALIPNGIAFADPGDAADPAPPAPASPAGPLIASVGRLERYKGHHRALAALPHLLADEPDARLWIAGAGPEEGRLRAQARRLGLSDRVEISSVPPEDPGTMARRLRAASLVVLLSELETHPIAALEAQALGRPLLVADRPGLRDFARRGEARAVGLDAGPSEVAAAMLRQLRDPLAAPAATVAAFTWDACTDGLHELYARVAVEARCGS